MKLKIRGIKNQSHNLYYRKFNKNKKTTRKSEGKSEVRLPITSDYKGYPM